jgi:hypothetical protein
MKNGNWRQPLSPECSRRPSENEEAARATQTNLFLGHFADDEGVVYPKNCTIAAVPHDRRRSVSD